MQFCFWIKLDACRKQHFLRSAIIYHFLIPQRTLHLEQLQLWQLQCLFEEERKNPCWQSGYSKYHTTRTVCTKRPRIDQRDYLWGMLFSAALLIIITNYGETDHLEGFALWGQVLQHKMDAITHCVYAVRQCCGRDVTGGHKEELCVMTQHFYPCDLLKCWSHILYMSRVYLSDLLLMLFNWPFVITGQHGLWSHTKLHRRGGNTFNQCCWN